MTDLWQPTTCVSLKSQEWQRQKLHTSDAGRKNGHERATQAKRYLTHMQRVELLTNRTTGGREVFEVGRHSSMTPSLNRNELEVSYAQCHYPTMEENSNTVEQERSEGAVVSDTSTASDSSSRPKTKTITKTKSSSKKSSSHRTGRWSLDEKILFLYGLRKFGKGRWKKISVFLPNR